MSSIHDDILDALDRKAAPAPAEPERWIDGTPKSETGATRDASGNVFDAARVLVDDQYRAANMPAWRVHRARTAEANRIAAEEQRSREAWDRLRDNRARLAAIEAVEKQERDEAQAVREERIAREMEARRLKQSI